MPLYIGDYLRDTMHLTTIQHGAYLMVLMAMWSSPSGKLNFDVGTLCRITGLTPEQWQENQLVLMKFFTVEGNEFYQKRLIYERVRNEELRRKRAEVGKLGGRPRKPIGLENQKVKQNETNHNHNHNHSTQPELQAQSEPESTRKNGDAKRLRELWCASYLSERGVKYSFAGAKDGMAVNRLLNVVTPEEAVKIAESAWEQTDPSSHWNCVHQSATLAVFASKINEIRSELSRSEKAQVKPTLSLSELNTVLRTKEELAAEFKEQWSSPCAMGPKWREDGKRLEWVKMRSEIRRLKKQIADMG